MGLELAIFIIHLKGTWRVVVYKHFEMPELNNVGLISFYNT